MQHGADRLELEIMRLGVSHSFPVKIGNMTISMRPLSSMEMVACHSAVENHLSNLPVSHRSEVARNTHLAREFIKKASSPFETYAPQITDSHLDKMTNGQVMAVYKDWLAISDKVNPELEKLTEEQLRELVDHVKKNKPDDLLSQLTELSFGQLASLVQFLLTKGD